MPKQERGEHSRESDPNDDEKPLKKARYVWEVKGKYHLKETHKNNNVDSLVTNNVTVTEKPTREMSDCANKQNPGCVTSHCCIESFLAKTEAIMTRDDDEESSTNNNTAEENRVPVSLVSSRPRNQEYYLQKWQAKQIARCFVDNTINSVLETWSNPPFDASDFVENCSNDGQVEDDAILMAIQSHGLQSSPQLGAEFSTNSPANNNSEIDESTRENLRNFQTELVKEHENLSDGDVMNSGYSNQGDSELGDDVDFLNAAVSAAIQKKGLSYS